MSTTNTTGMSDAAKVYNEYGEWWCDFVDYRGHQCHYLALHCIGNMASWLQEKDAEIERLKEELLFVANESEKQDDEIERLLNQLEMERGHRQADRNEAREDIERLKTERDKESDQQWLSRVSGIGRVSEQDAEIERLKAELQKVRMTAFFQVQSIERLLGIIK